MKRSTGNEVTARDAIQTSLYEETPETRIKGKVTILPPQDVFDTLAQVDHVACTILDPWYNKGYGGARPDYHEWLSRVLTATARVSDHIYLWGFPDIIHKALDYLPKGTKLVAWLTWYYKNCPSVIRGWRPAQFTCLHISQDKARLYPEHFLNGVQKERFENGKMRFVPGPPSVIETSLLVGFVGRKEQTGHPSQKPVKTIEPLVLMATREDDTVLDPFCGSGTTGIVCRDLGRHSILCDASEEYTEMTEKRLGIKRTTQPESILARDRPSKRKTARRAKKATRKGK